MCLKITGFLYFFFFFFLMFLWFFFFFFFFFDDDVQDFFFAITFRNGSGELLQQRCSSESPSLKFIIFVLFGQQPRLSVRRRSRVIPAPTLLSS